jgi:hypothetical protein
MSSLSSVEKQRCEDLLAMSNGYVLNFTDEKFRSFFQQDIGINIYDPRFAFNGPSKAKRLRAFWDVEDGKIVGRALEKLLELWRYLNEPGKDARLERLYEECMRTVSRLLGTVPKEETESEFLKRDLGTISVTGLGLDAGLEEILAARVKEAMRCVTSGAPLSAIFMCGSILEGLLLAVALRNPSEFNRASASPKRKESEKVKPFDEWTLANLIDVSHEVGLLRLDVKKFGHALRDFRNYIHPYAQMASAFNPDGHTAQICMQVLRVALVGLKASGGVVKKG